MHVRDLLLSIGFILTGCDNASEPAEGSRGIGDYCDPRPHPCLIINRKEFEGGGMLDPVGNTYGKIERESIYRCDPERISVVEIAPQTLAVQCTAFVEAYTGNDLKVQPTREADLALQIELSPEGPMRMTGGSTIGGISDGQIDLAGVWGVEETVFGTTDDLDASVSNGWFAWFTFRLEPPAGMVLQPPVWPPE